VGRPEGTRLGKINFSGGMILDLHEIALVLSVFIRGHPWLK